MAPLRALIDSMVFDAVVAEELSGLVGRATDARRLELLAAAASLEQIARTPDPDHRRALRRVRVLAVAPADPEDPEAGAVLAALQASPGVDDDDAHIAAAAWQTGAPLVTEDRALRAAAQVHLPEVAVWSWAADLRPRILAL